MINDIESILMTEEQLHEKVCEIGRRISEDYEDKFPVFVGVLKGSFMFMADIMRQVTIPCQVDFMAVSSYGSGTSTTGAVKINKDLSQDIEGRHVVIIEDILDSGVTLGYLTKYLQNRNPASITIATLLDKPARRTVPFDPDFRGTIIPDEFVIGYGLDYDEKYRNLPFVGILKREVYEK
jgi:hypoxanthine phosphoribosyltransferase